MKNENQRNPENNIKYKIQKGMLCSFDPENYLKQKNSEISHVLILKRLKYIPGNNSLWLVQNADDVYSEPFKCPEKLLKPMNIACVRIPTELPEFNSTDLYIIEELIRVLDRSEGMKFYRDNVEKDSCDLVLYEKHLNRLKAIREKIKFSIEMRDV